LGRKRRRGLPREQVGGFFAVRLREGGVMIQTSDVHDRRRLGASDQRAPHTHRNGSSGVTEQVAVAGPRPLSFPPPPLSAASLFLLILHVRRTVVRHPPPPPVREPRWSSHSGRVRRPHGRTRRSFTDRRRRVGSSRAARQDEQGTPKTCASGIPGPRSAHVSDPTRALHDLRISGETPAPRFRSRIPRVGRLERTATNSRRIREIHSK